jgi:hypothetical protein
MHRDPGARDSEARHAYKWFQVHYYLRLLVSKGKFDIAKNGKASPNRLAIIAKRENK